MAAALDSSMVPASPAPPARAACFTARFSTLVTPGAANEVEDVLQHALGDGVVGDDSIGDGADGDYVFGRPPQHLTSFLADSNDLAGLCVGCNNRWFTKNDPLATNGYKNVCRAEIDADVVA